MRILQIAYECMYEVIVKSGLFDGVWYVLLFSCAVMVVFLPPRVVFAVAERRHWPDKVGWCLALWSSILSIAGLNIAATHDNWVGSAARLVQPLLPFVAAIVGAMGMIGVCLVLREMQRARTDMPSQDESDHLLHEDELRVEALIQDLRAGDLTARRKAIATCAQIGADAAPAAGALVEAYFFWDIEDEDVYEEVQEDVTRALISIGPSCAPVVILNLGADEMESYGDRILTGIGEPVIPALIAAIEDENMLSQVRIFWRVAGILGRFGAAAQTAIPALEKASRYNDPDYAKIAEEAIEKIRGG